MVKYSFVLPLLVSLLLCACQTAPGLPQSETSTLQFPNEDYRRLQSAGGTVYRLDPQASAVYIYVYRGGRLAAQGHNHVIAAGTFEGAVFIPKQSLSQARFDLFVPVEGLEVDPPEVRARLGGSFGGAVDDEARAGTRANMLGVTVLDADRHPHFVVQSRELAGEMPKLMLKAKVTLRGVSREQWVPVDLRIDDNALVARGSLVISQEAFDIQPFSALGGLLKVQDRLLIEFNLVGAPLPPP